MAISCRSLYEEFSDSIGQTWGAERLAKKFITACNMALDDLMHDADETVLTHVASINDTIALSDQYTHIILAGIMYFATRLGVRPADPKIAQIVYDDTERMWERMKGQYARVLDNALQPDQSDAMADIGYLDEE